MVARLTNSSIPNYWPYPILPFSDELLSSWLVRNSVYAGLNPYRFCQRILPGVPIWDRDIDRFTPNVVFDKIAKLLEVNVDQVKLMTFKGVDGLSNVISPNFKAISPMILSLGIRGRNRTHYGTQFCPACLDENAYFRKCWRFAFYTHCQKHRCNLLDSCSYCGEKIIPHWASNLKCCWRCGKSLTEIGSGAVESLSLKIQPPLDLSHYGTSPDDTIRVMTNTELIANIRKLISVIVEVQSSYFKDVKQIKKLQFELLRINVRRRILIALNEIMSSWPHSFQIYMKSNNVTQRKFDRGNYSEVFKKQIDKLPLGRKVNRTYLPIIYTAELQALKNKAKIEYRARRANLLLQECSIG